MTFSPIYADESIWPCGTLEDWFKTPAYGVQWIPMSTGQTLFDHDYYYAGLDGKGRLYVWQTNNPWPELQRRGLALGLEKSDPEAFIKAGFKYGTTEADETFEETRPIAIQELKRLYGG